jgi:hypothetical protein
MPIKRELRSLYPANWQEISREVRFTLARGECQTCGRPHGKVIRCLRDGRWFDPAQGTWRTGRGKFANWPDIEEAVAMRQTLVFLSAAHLDHNPAHNQFGNLKCLCQRCHLMYDQVYHLAQRRITFLMSLALGDLFAGPYSAVAVMTPAWKLSFVTLRIAPDPVHPTNSDPRAHRLLGVKPFGRLNNDNAHRQRHRHDDQWKQAALDLNRVEANALKIHVACAN